MRNLCLMGIFCILTVLILLQYSILINYKGFATLPIEGNQVKGRHRLSLYYFLGLQVNLQLSQIKMLNSK